MKVQYPAPVNDFQVKFWRYSLKDLARIAAPGLAGWLTAGPAGLALGSATGLGLAEIQPYGRNLDQLALDYIDYRLSPTDFSIEPEIRGDTIVLDDETVVGLVKVDSVDLDLASSTEWQMNRDTVGDLFKEISYPIEIHSLKNTVNLSQYQGASDSVEATDHYVVIHDKADKDSKLPWKNAGFRPLKEKIDTVSDRCRKIRNTLTAGDLHAEHLTGEELNQTLQKLKYRYKSLKKSVINGPKKGANRILYLTEYPEEQGPGLLSDLLNLDVPGSIEVIQTAEPVTEKERQKLGRLITRLQVESVATPDQIRGSDIDRMAADAQDMVEVTTTGDERLIHHGVYIIVHGKYDAINETMDEVTRMLRRSQVEYQEPWLRTHRAFRTISPFHSSVKPNSVMMPTRSAAGSFAFSTHDKIEEGGIVFGEDTRNGLPVILDRFQWEGNDIARMGKKGSGKSYAAKTGLLRSIQQYPDLQIRIIDPKKEYGYLNQKIGGKDLAIDETDLETVRLNENYVRYTVSERGRKYSNELHAAIRHIYQDVSRDRRRTIVLVDEAHRLLTSANSRAALGELVREGRDRNVSVEMVTQNASDFTRSQEGRDILKNVNCYIFMRHQEVDNGVSNFFQLSPQQALELQRLRTGNELPFSEAVIRGPINTKLRIEATPKEHEIAEKDVDIL